MATTVAAFSAIDDTEVDAESPITESLMKRLRDNSYWINQGTNKTSQGSSGVWLEADGSGGVRWTTPTTIDGTKGTVTSLSTSYTTLTSASTGILQITVYDGPGGTNGTKITTIIDLSDDTWISAYQDDNTAQSTASGTLTGAGTIAGYLNNGGNQYLIRRSSGNVQVGTNTGTPALALVWVIL